MYGICSNVSTCVFSWKQENLVFHYIRIQRIRGMELQQQQGIEQTRPRSFETFQLKQWKMPKRKTPDVSQWCDNDLLNRVIGEGLPSAQVGVRLSQTSRMIRFLGSFDSVEYSFHEIPESFTSSLSFEGC